ncbi:hypothetical protein CAPTEDRAFT_106542, partial [Capitella teleta]
VLLTGADAACDVGWKSWKNRCYFFSTEQVLHDTATSKCIAEGATLLVIQSMAEQNYIATG